MSDSLIAWKPRIDEPSKPRPSEKVSSPNVDAGMVVLHDAGKVAEANVDVLDVVVAD